MHKLKSFWTRLRGLFGARQKDNDFAAELESHLALHIEDGMLSGLSAEEARRQALIRLGGVEQARQQYRERATLPAFETLLQDVRFALRQLRRSPGFASIAIVTLALGIGADTAIFSVVDGVLLHPLPFPHPQQLVTLDESKPNFATGSISWPNFRDWQRDNRTLAGLAIERPMSLSLTGEGVTERLRGDYVSSGFFSLLGVKPVLGRLFAPGEDEIGRAPVVLISQGLWERKFGSNRAILGKAIQLDGRAYTIAGIVPSSFEIRLMNFHVGDVYVPIGQWQVGALLNRQAGLGIHGIARLKPGVTLAQAQADMKAVTARLAAAYPQDDRGVGATLIPLRQFTLRNAQPLLLALLGAVTFVLLIACINVAGLLLARSGARSQEFAIRAALGAGRPRIVRQLLTESAMLSLAGGALGLVLANWGAQAVYKLIPIPLPRAVSIHLNVPMLCFALAISFSAGILFGLFPAFKVARSVQGALAAGGRSVSGRQTAMQSALVVFEMALALVLLVCAGLSIRSVVALSRVNPGFDPNHVTLFSLAAPPAMRNAPPDAVRQYYREAGRRMAAVPGVEGVSFVPDGGLPLTGNDDERLFWLDNEARPADTSAMHWSLDYMVEPDYLKILHIPLLRGRFFTTADDEKSPLVTVVDESFAHKYFGDSNPIGRQIHVDGTDRPVTIVGEVGHVMEWGLDNEAAFPLHAELYLPLMQLPQSGWELEDSLAVDAVLRSNSASVMTDLRSAMRKMDREQVIYGDETMNEIVAQSLAPWRFAMVLMGLFGALALLLASVGIYGVISCLVSQRTREIGIRMALGADRAGVMHWVMAKGGRLVAVGAGMGIAGALALAWATAHTRLLYGVHGYDPITIAGVTALLAAVALAACYAPARRATRVDPMQALRME